MKRIMLVGESPLGCSGNSNMMRGFLETLDRRKYSVAVYGTTTTLLIKTNLFTLPPYTYLPAASSVSDKWGANGLMDVLKTHPVDLVLFVGIDVWAFNGIYEQMKKLQKLQPFITAGIFPYDAVDWRKDWVHWFNMIDFPCVYSKYGFDKIRKTVPNLRYFRPNLFGANIFKSLPAQKRLELRAQYFPSVTKESFLFGFVGNNQVRKDPQKTILAYAKLKKENPNIDIYLHTEMEQGVYNLSQCALDLGLKTGDIISKGPKQNKWVNVQMMTEIYNCFNALLNTSLQEGLSWTLLEAMLCGCPIIASDTTGQTELVKGVGHLIPCTQDTYMPVVAGKGQSWIRTLACSVDDVVAGMKHMIGDEGYRERCKEAGLQEARNWLTGISNINELMEDCFIPQGRARVHLGPQEKKKRVLYVQHSSAGDILMTTRVLKGLKERYRVPLDYMTQKKYMDIVTGNPYISKVLEWDEETASDYLYVLNPHKERILPGHWGRNCNSILADFYWKILMVEPDGFFIEKVRPSTEIADEIESVAKNALDRYTNLDEGKPIAVVHTTGGDPHFRTYKYMSDVCKVLKEKYTTVQLGGDIDFPAEADINLCGKLTFRETAWVMNHAVVAVTVDSFLSHLAGILGVSQVCLFGSGNVFVVRPKQMKGHLSCLVPDYVRDCQGLGPCSGVVRNCAVPCTSIHNPKTILFEIKKMEAKDLVKRGHEHTTATYEIQWAE